ncbi:MAG: hypothetical protein JW725_02805 [Candidatus Babeliaceae bacterium]|nr:hypothetical protein [Candidatus Babeliaceae bacterium]
MVHFSTEIYKEGIGGIFTTALIEAIRGDADKIVGDRNGITIMNELETYLVGQVTSKSRLRKLEQYPSRKDFGKGQFVFIHDPGLLY